MQTIDPKQLEEKLRKEKTVRVEGDAFRIRKVPLLLLADEADDLWETARQGHEALADKIRALVKSPSLSRMRRVLLAGVVEPRLSPGAEEGSVCVELVLSSYALSAGLFIEIVNYSLEV